MAEYRIINNIIGDNRDRQIKDYRKLSFGQGHFLPPKTSLDGMVIATTPYGKKEVTILNKSLDIEYKIDVNSKEGMIVKNSKGYYASHKDYGFFLDVFKIFIGDTSNAIFSKKLTFTLKSLARLPLCKKHEIETIFKIS